MRLFLVGMALWVLTGAAWAAPIHDAVNQGDTTTVKTMIEADAACLSLADSQGLQPLHLAAGKGDLPMLELLLSLGANVNAATRQKWTPLHEATSQGRVEAVRFLLAHGGNVNARESQNQGTCLHIAAFHGNLDLVKALVSGGANVNVKDGEGLTPLFHAKDQGHTALVTYLKSLGAR